MQPILTREQIRAYDRLATELCGIPSILLMENAGRGATDVVVNLASPSLGDSVAKSVTIVCGTGNNGGDGFVVARHLQARGFQPQVFLVGDANRIVGDAKINFAAMIACGIEYRNASLLENEVNSTQIIIDAIFGTGISRNIEGVAAEVIDAINKSPALKISLDLPSGLDAYTGAVLGHAVKAQHTITFAYPKPGLYTPQGKIHAGKIHTVNLGVPDTEILKQIGIFAELISLESISTSFKKRDATTYKHKAGDILVVAGSPGKTGAAKLVAEATLRAGAGLATICTWSEAMPAFEKELKEIMLAPLDSNNIPACLTPAMAKRSAIVVGPGFGLSPQAGEVLRYILKSATCPLVLDADAITLAAEFKEDLKLAHAAKILTPHTGELGRLLDLSSAAIEANRYSAARKAAALTDAIVILKGAHTIVASPQGKIFVSAEANPVLATAGSGDVLSGIIGAFAATMPAFEAACAGVYVHAQAGNLWSEKFQADRGMLASDISEFVPLVVGSFVE